MSQPDGPTAKGAVVDGGTSPLTSPVPADQPASNQFVAGKEFHLKEYDSLKKEIGDLVEHSRKLEIYALGGIAAFYAWFLQVCPRPSRLSLLVPILLAALGAFRSWSVLTRIGEVAEYLLKVESVFALSERGLGGWETHRSAKNTSPFASSAAVFWLVLLAVSFAAACVLKTP